MSLLESLSLLVIGVYLGYQGPVWFTYIYLYFASKQLMADSVPQKVDENKLCKNRHDWIEALTFMGTKSGKTRLCRLCGFIPELNLMASYEAIDRIEENNKIRQLESKMQKDFFDKEDGDIKKFFAKEIENGVNVDKLIQLHTAGITFAQRYNSYKLSRASEIEKEIAKSDA